MADRYQLQIGERGMPNAYVQANPVQNNIGAAVAGLGSQVGKLAGAALRKKEELDMVRVEEALNEYAKWNLDYTNNPDTGIFNSPSYKYGQAEGLTGKYEVDSKAAAEKIAGSLSDPKQKAAFMRKALPGSMPFYKSVQDYESKQMEEFKGVIFEDGLEGDSRTVMLFPTDAETMSQAAENVRNRFELRYIGMPPEAVAKMADEKISAIDKARIELIAGTDPMLAYEEAKNSKYLLPADAAELKKSVRGEVERVEAQGIVDKLVEKFGPDDEIKGHKWIHEHYSGEREDRVNAAYNQRISELTIHEASREESLRKFQKANWDKFQARRANGDMYSHQELLDAANRGDISWEQYNQGERLIALDANRKNIERGIMTKDPARWDAMTPTQREEAVMRKAGRTQRDRDEAISKIQNGITDGSLTGADIDDFYDDMYITGEEKAAYKKTLENYWGSGSLNNIVKGQKLKMEADLGGLFGGLYFSNDASKALEGIAKDAFSSEVLGLDAAGNSSYQEEVRAARVHALAAAIDAVEDGDILGIFLSEHESQKAPETTYTMEEFKADAAGVLEKAEKEAVSRPRPRFRVDGIDLSEPAGDFDESLRRVFQTEGGYVNNPNDKGGETNMGIIKATLNAAKKAGIVNHSDSKSLTRAEAEDIYKKMFWEPSRAGDMPAGIGYQVLDMAVLHGVPKAMRILQAALGLKPTGKAGQATVDAVWAADPRGLVSEIKERKQGMYYSIVEKDPAQREFLRGWTNRNNRVAAESMDMAGEQPTLDDLFGGTFDGLK
jgi:lysozyme family protein